MNFTFLKYINQFEFQQFTKLHIEEKKIEIKNFISKKIKLPVENLYPIHGIKIEKIAFDVNCPDCNFKIGNGEINNEGIISAQFIFKITTENIEKDYKIGLHFCCKNLHEYFDNLE